jgi:ATP-dependent exoDNAse (exonuclease V) beta subunit
MFLSAVRAHASIAFWPTGEQALGNCQRMIEMAQNFERHAFSFRSFIEKLDSDSEGGEIDEAPIVEEGTEGVRILTVHKSKGLEFPVVILADPTCPATHSAPSRHVDPARGLWLEPLCGSTPIELLEASPEELQHDKAEAIRLAYVAATRVRDLLVVPVTGDQPIKGWLDVLNPMLYPQEGLRQNAGLAPGCPEFAQETVLDRGPKGKVPREGAVRPGLHKPGRNGPPITWWDPATLTLDVEEQTSLRHQRLLEADSDELVSSKSEHDYVAWKTAREELLRVASRPSMRVQTVTSLSRNQSVGHDSAPAASVYPSVQIEVMQRSVFERPGGRRFGFLVHTLLASIDLDANPEAVRSMTTINGRMVNATEDEVKEASVVVGAALGHPILRRAAASAAKGRLRRETPILYTLGNGDLAEGVVDLAFQEEEAIFVGWTIIDFKTDRELGTSSERYVAQVRMYAEAIAKATALPARGIVMVI